MFFRPTRSLPNVTIILASIIFVTIGCFSVIYLPELKDSVKTGNLLIYSVASIPLITVISLVLTVQYKGVSLALRRADLLFFALIFFILLNRFLQQPETDMSLNCLELIFLCIFYFANALLPVKFCRVLLLGILVSGLIEILIGYSQLFAISASNHKLFRVTGSFNNPGPFSGYIAVPIAIALGDLFRNRKLPAKSFQWYGRFTFFINICVVFIGVPMLAIARSRAAILAISVVLIFNLIRSIPRWTNLSIPVQKILKKSAFFILPLVILGLTKGLYFFNVDSGNGRLLIWKISKNIFFDHPLFGVGYDNTKMYYMSYQGRYFEHEGSETEERVAGNVTHVFNDHLQFVVENGIIGSLGLCAFVSILLYSCRKAAETKCVIICCSGLASICIFSFFSYSGDILPIKVVAVALISVLAKTDQKSFLLPLPSSRFRIAFITCAFLTTLFLSYLITAWVRKTYHNYREWKNAEHLYSQGDYGNAVKAYAHLFDKFSTEGSFLVGYGKALSFDHQEDKAMYVLARASQFHNTPNVQIAMAELYRHKKLYTAAEKCYIDAANMIPELLYPRYLCAKLYYESGELIRAKKEGEYIVNKKQNVSSPAARQMRREMKVMLAEIKKKTAPTRTGF